MSCFKHIYILFLLIGLVSCGDGIVVPTPNESAPVFKSEVLIDGVPLNVEAGENDYDVDVDIKSVSQEYAFTSYFKPSSCNINCPRSLQYIIHSSVPGRLNVDMEKSIGNLSKSFFEETQNDSIELFLLNTSFDLASQTVNWTFNARGIKPERLGDTLVLRFPALARMQLCVQGFDDQRNDFQQCQTFVKDDISNPLTEIQASLVSANEVALTAVELENPSGRATEGYWEHDRSSSPRIVVAKSRANVNYCYTTKITGTSVSTTTCIKLQTADNLRDLRSRARFRMKRWRLSSENPVRWRGKVEIIYTDENRVRYSSRLTKNRDHSFEILDQEVFTDPNTNVDLYKVTSEWSANLVSGQGKVITLTGGNSVIPLEILQ